MRVRAPLEKLSGKVLVSIEGMNKDCEDGARMVRKLCINFMEFRFLHILSLLKVFTSYLCDMSLN